MVGISLFGWEGREVMIATKTAETRKQTNNNRRVRLIFPAGVSQTRLYGEYSAVFGVGPCY